MHQMKCSHSMSSLATTPENRKSPTNSRLSSSSRRPRRTFEKKMWRRSWQEGSYDDGGGDDVQINEEIHSHHGNVISTVTVETNLGQFLEDYTVICDWLNYAQVQRGKSADVGTLRELGTELLRRQPWRIQINESAASLLRSFPLLKEECGWRMRHLNSQWDALEKILLCQSPPVSVETGKKLGNPSGIDWLRDWLTEMENQLQPLDFRTQWSSELVGVLGEFYKGLQSEIESKSDKVHESLREFGEREGAKKARLEKRWWQLRLRVLEWIQHLEGVSLSHKKGNRIGRESVLSSDEEEPLTKYRRLGNGDSLVTEVHSNEFIDEDVVMGQNSVDAAPQLTTPPPQSSSITSSQNLKRKSTLKHYSKFPTFEAFQLKFGDFLTEANISTYYFKHSEAREVLAVSMETGDSSLGQKSETEGSKKLDAVQLSDQLLSDREGVKLDQCVPLVTMETTSLVTMETGPTKLEKEIGDLVEKAEELAKKNAVENLDFLTQFSSSEDEFRENMVAIETAPSAKINRKSFASLKAKFTEMEEILSETRRKICEGGSGGVKSGCAGGGVGKKVKTARVRQWVRQNSKEGDGCHGSNGRKNRLQNSCDASGESDSSSTSSHISSHSSDDPTTTTSTLLHQTQATLNYLRNRDSSSSEDFLRNKKLRPLRQSFEVAMTTNSNDGSSDGFGGNSEGSTRKKRVKKKSRRKSEEDLATHQNHVLLPRFQISGPVSEKPAQITNNASDMGSLNTEQDWDSYQEKYLSEPYSEEAYDPNDTLKLLAFGEDYGTFLDLDQEIRVSSGEGFGQRRVKTTMSSDSEEETLLQKSQSQLNFVENLFNKFHGKEADFVTMETACLSNLSLLSTLPPTPLHTHWENLHQKLTTSKLTQISKEITSLKLNFSKFHSTFEHFSPFDSQNLPNLHSKIENVSKMLQELMDRKLILQNLNSVSMTTSKFFNPNQNQEIKNQMVELYQLYEENFQLGTYLLEKMRYLQTAWEKFEQEKTEFERLVSMGRLRKDLNSAGSTDSGHVTDDFVSDSDLDTERKLRLDCLRKCAGEITSWLPEGSEVLGRIEMTVHEAEKGLEDLRLISMEKIQTKKSWKPKAKKCRPGNNHQIRKFRTTPRKWKLVRGVVGLNFALMGLFLAAAYFLHPNCCEFTNTFCFSLVPHLTHESVPPI